ncbi:uncharacterized protein [Thunnus thynnus]|uniref:uncharacterized protein isoform X4 n=1 Tax=Thunnus thynnus TaxID=8237 RepID=UPI0035284D4E
MCIRYLGYLLLIWFPGLHAQTTSCPAPELEDGYFLPERKNYFDKDQVTYACNKGSKPEVEGWWATSTCQEGKWHPEPKCIGKDACTLPNIPNAKCKHDNELTIRVTCDKGYIINDSRKATSTCENGTWSSLPVCEESPEACGAPPKIPNAVIINQEYQDVFAADSEVQYECKDGFTVEGADTKKTITCVSREWSTGPPCSGGSGSAVGGTGGGHTTSAGSGTQPTGGGSGSAVGGTGGGHTTSAGSGTQPTGGGRGSGSAVGGTGGGHTTSAGSGTQPTGGGGGSGSAVGGTGGGHTTSAGSRTQPTGGGSGTRPGTGHGDRTQPTGGGSGTRPGTGHGDRTQPTGGGSGTRPGTGHGDRTQPTGGGSGTRPGTGHGGRTQPTGGGSGTRPGTGHGDRTQPTGGGSGTRPGTGHGDRTQPTGGGSSVSSGSNGREGGTQFTTIDKCGRFPQISDGDVVEKREMSLRYRCSSFHKLVGLETVRCYSSGTWSEVPTCKASYCSVDTAEYYLLQSVGVIFLEYGERKRFECVKPSRWSFAHYSFGRCNNGRMSFTKCCMWAEHAVGC